MERKDKYQVIVNHLEYGAPFEQAVVDFVGGVTVSLDKAVKLIEKCVQEDQDNYDNFRVEWNAEHDCAVVYGDFDICIYQIVVL